MLSEIYTRQQGGSCGAGSAPHAYVSLSAPATVSRDTVSRLYFLGASAHQSAHGHGPDGVLTVQRIVHLPRLARVAPATAMMNGIVLRDEDGNDVALMQVLPAYSAAGTATAGPKAAGASKFRLARYCLLLLYQNRPY